MSFRSFILLFIGLFVLTGCSTSVPSNKSSNTTPSSNSKSIVPIKPISVKLAWKPSADTNVIGYRIYYGIASRSYTNSIDVSNALQFTVTGLLSRTLYYFTATAYNILGMESGFSNEVSYPPPALTNIIITVTGQSLQYSGSAIGPWTPTGINNLTFTNPVGNMFFLGTNSVISTKRF